MKAIDLFCMFNFHDGDMEKIRTTETGIVMDFSLAGFLQYDLIKNTYDIGKDEKCYLYLVVKFDGCSQVKCEPFVDICALDLEPYWSWYIGYDEKEQEIIIQLANDMDKSLLTISFQCESVEVVSCEKRKL